MRKRARPAWLIFLATLFIYQANLRPVASQDSLPAALLPFSILIDRCVHFDRFEPFLQGSQPGRHIIFARSRVTITPPIPSRCRSF